MRKITLLSGTLPHMNITKTWQIFSCTLCGMPHLSSYFLTSALQLHAYVGMENTEANTHETFETYGYLIISTRAMEIIYICSQIKPCRSP